MTSRVPFFVYGRLRPDERSSLAIDFCQFALIQPATLPNAMLYMDALQQPVLFFPSNSIDPPSHVDGYLITAHNEEQHQRMCSISARTEGQDGVLKQVEVDGRTVSACVNRRPFDEVERLTRALQIPSGNWSRKASCPFVDTSMSEVSSIRNIFVYGTLRSDVIGTPNERPWTKKFADMTTCVKASVRGLQLLFDVYPMVPYPSVGPVSDDVVLHGLLATAKKSQSSWDELLFMTDQIEGYPKYYQRGVVEVDVDGDGGRVLAFLYFRLNLPSSGFRIETLISSGNFKDWKD